jgi:DTW domain-containing protein
VVFPGEFADPARVVTALRPEPSDGAGPGGDLGGAPRAARPLFVLLDGTWSEARKMFRKSPYLARLPVLSLQPDQLKRYRLRRSSHAHHFCTSEVAALCLAMAGDLPAAQALEAYLDVFTHHYLQARQSVPPDTTTEAHQRLREALINRR